MSLLDDNHSDASGSGGDDSLVDVENHIREIESYLHSDAAASGLGPSPLLALAGSRGRPNPTPSPPPHPATAASAAAGATSSHTNTTISSHASTPRVAVDLTNKSSRLSTPSTVSTLESYYRDEHEDDFHNAADSSSSSSAAHSIFQSNSNPSTARSNVSSTTISSVASLDKDRMVQQLLQQHRQAQVTASAHSRPPPPPAAAALPMTIERRAERSESTTHTQQPSQTIQSVDRQQRDALVERLLQERRRQKEKGETQHQQASPESHQPSHQQVNPYTHTTNRSHTQSNQTNAYSQSIQHPPPHRQQQQQQQHHHQQQQQHPHLSHSHHSSHHSVSSSIHDDGSIIDDHTDHDSSIHSFSGGSISSPAHTNASGSSVNSPLDPRFAQGIGQTIFDASEWINEDGTSIIHSNPPTHRSENVEEEDDDDANDSSIAPTDSVADDSIDRSNHTSPTHHAHHHVKPALSRPTSSTSTKSSSSSVGSFRPTRAQQIHTSGRPATAASARNGGVRSASATRKTVPHQQQQPQPHPSASARRSSSVKRPSTASSSVVRGGGGVMPHAIPGGSRYSKASIIAEIESERAREHTFAPKLISKPLVSSDASLEERLAAWQQRAAKNHARKVEAARAYEEEQLAECTFAPKTNVSRKVRLDPDSAVDRLYHEADHRTLLRERARLLNEADQLESHPFTPALSDTSRKVVERRHTNQRPIFQRIAELQKDKNMKLHEMRLKAETSEESENKFVPKINPTSIAIVKQMEQRTAQTTGESASTTDGPDASGSSMSQSASTRLLERKLHTSHTIALEQQRECTFQPEINPVSKKLVKKNSLFGGTGVGVGGTDGHQFIGPSADFLTRQERLEESRRAEQKEAEYEARHNPEFTFKPDIGNANEILKASRKRLEQLAKTIGTNDGNNDGGTGDGVEQPLNLPPCVGEETPEQLVERMSSHDARHLTLLKSKLRSLENQRSGHTFVPEISNVSRALAEKRAEDLSAAGVNEDQVRSLAQDLLVQRLQKEFVQQHPFQPKLNPTSKEMVESGLVESHYSHTDMSRQTQQLVRDSEKRQRHLDSLARAKQVAELEECTFAPTLLTRPKSSSSTPSASAAAPIEVKGMNRFMELKSLKAKQDAELKERQRKVFLLDVGKESVKDRPPYTIAQPFTLSHQQRSSYRDAQREKAERETEERRMRECTFVPTTKQAQNRQMIQMILQEVDE